MVWCVLFVGLLMFDLGFVCGCMLGSHKTSHPIPTTSAVTSPQGKEKVPYEPTDYEKSLMEDFKMINEFNGYKEVTEDHE